MRTIVVAPHPDDEVLGVGGTLLRRQAEGGTVAWLIMTGISVEGGWSADRVLKRAKEIERVASIFNFESVYELNFPAAQLDQVPMGDLVVAVANVFKKFAPEEVFVPHPSDIHTDHRIAFDAAVSCAKWFRAPSVTRILAYETLSETDFGLSPISGFRPNVFVDIESFLDEKIRALDAYTTEVGVFPFPRSHEAVRALATLRGAGSGFMAAEAFELLRERV